MVRRRLHLHRARRGRSPRTGSGSRTWRATRRSGAPTGTTSGTTRRSRGLRPFAGRGAVPDPRGAGDWETSASCGAGPGSTTRPFSASRAGTSTRPPPTTASSASAASGTSPPTRRPAPSPPPAQQARPPGASAYAYVPPGTFEMGCVAGDRECQDDEKPSRRVELTQGFWVGRTEVTVAAFREFVSATGHRTTAESDGWSRVFDGRSLVKKEGVSWQAPGFEQGPGHPVVHVSWYDAVGVLRVGRRPPAHRGGVRVRGACGAGPGEVPVGRRAGAPRRAVRSRRTWPTSR